MCVSLSVCVCVCVCVCVHIVLKSLLVYCNREGDKLEIYC